MAETEKSMSRATRDSLTQFVERQLRESILMGKFAPGTRLNIRELSEQLGTSATPIREALMRLSAQRILEARPGQFCVPVISRAKYQEISDVRLVVENMAAERAVENYSADDLKRIEGLAEQYIEAIYQGQYALAVELHAQFKFALFEASKMPTLTAIIEDLMLQVAPLFIDAISPPRVEPSTWVPTNVQYIRQIVQGLRDRNSSLVCHAVQGLIMTATRHVVPELPDDPTTAR